MPVAVIGIGQRLRGDDAAGLEAVRLWQRVFVQTAARPDIRVHMVEEPGLDLLDLLEGMDAAVLVDAVCSHGDAGTLHHISPSDLAKTQENPASAHGWGVAQALRLGSALDTRARQPVLRLLGIEASHVEIGEGLSEPVRQSLAAASEAIQDEVVSLLKS